MSSASSRRSDRQDISESREGGTHGTSAAIGFYSVYKTYESDTGVPIAALMDFNLEVKEGEILCLLGPSGSGKTTVLNLAAAFIQATAGSVRVKGRDLHDRPMGCGFVFQSDAVFPWLSVAENIGYGLRWNGMTTRDRKEVVDRYVGLVGLSEFRNRWPRELSGGMKKRVDVARAFAFNSPILLMDESFGLLDAITKEEMQDLLLKIWRSDRKTVLFVTHDVEEAAYLGHRVGVMSQRPGRIKRLIDIPFPFEQRTPALRTTVKFVELRKAIRAVLDASTAESSAT